MIIVTFGFKHCRNKGLSVIGSFQKQHKLKELYLQGDVLLWFRLSPSAATTCLLRSGVSSEDEAESLTNESKLYSA